jgi:hypothetical protein
MCQGKTRKAVEVVQAYEGRVKTGCTQADTGVSEEIDTFQTCSKISVFASTTVAFQAVAYLRTCDTIKNNSFWLYLDTPP